MTPQQAVEAARVKAAADPEGDAIMRALWFDLSDEIRGKFLAPKPVEHRARYAFLVAYLDDKSPEDCVAAARNAARI